MDIFQIHITKSSEELNRSSIISEFLLKEGRNTWLKVTQNINIYQKKKGTSSEKLSHLLED